MTTTKKKMSRNWNRNSTGGTGGGKSRNGEGFFGGRWSSGGGGDDKTMYAEKISTNGGGKAAKKYNYLDRDNPENDDGDDPFGAEDGRDINLNDLEVMGSGAGRSATDTHPLRRVGAVMDRVGGGSNDKSAGNRESKRLLEPGDLRQKLKAHDDAGSANTPAGEVESAKELAAKSSEGESEEDGEYVKEVDSGAKVDVAIAEDMEVRKISITARTVEGITVSASTHGHERRVQRTAAPSADEERPEKEGVRENGADALDDDDEEDDEVREKKQRRKIRDLNEKLKRKRLTSEEHEKKKEDRQEEGRRRDASGDLDSSTGSGKSRRKESRNRKRDDDDEDGELVLLVVYTLV